LLFCSLQWLLDEVVNAATPLVAQPAAAAACDDIYHLLDIHAARGILAFERMLLSQSIV